MKRLDADTFHDRLCHIVPHRSYVAVDFLTFWAHSFAPKTQKKVPSRSKRGTRVLRVPTPLRANEPSTGLSGRTTRMVVAYTPGSTVAGCSVPCPESLFPRSMLFRTTTSGYRRKFGDAFSGLAGSKTVTIRRLKRRDASTFSLLNSNLTSTLQEHPQHIQPPRSPAIPSHASSANA